MAPGLPVVAQAPHLPAVAPALGVPVEAPAPHLLAAAPGLALPTPAAAPAPPAAAPRRRRRHHRRQRQPRRETPDRSRSPLDRQRSPSPDVVMDGAERDRRPPARQAVIGVPGEVLVVPVLGRPVSPPPLLENLGVDDMPFPPSPPRPRSPAPNRPPSPPAGQNDADGEGVPPPPRGGMQRAGTQVKQTRLGLEGAQHWRPLLYPCP